MPNGWASSIAAWPITERTSAASVKRPPHDYVAQALLLAASALLPTLAGPGRRSVEWRLDAARRTACGGVGEGPAYFCGAAALLRRGGALLAAPGWPGAQKRRVETRRGTQECV